MGIEHFRRHVTSADELATLIGTPDELVIRKQPVVGIGVEIEECYFQCAKAIIRSRLWQSVAEQPPSKPLDFARILIDQTKLEGQTVESLREQIAESCRDRLY